MPTVYLGNLPFDTTEQHLRDHLGPDAASARIRFLLRPDTGGPTGIALIDVDSHALAAGIIDALDGITLHGRAIVATNAADLPTHPRITPAGAPGSPVRRTSSWGFSGRGW